MSADILLLKQTIEKDGGQRINTLKFKKLDDGYIQVWLDMGGDNRWSKIKLDRSQAYLLILYLQEYLGAS